MNGTSWSDELLKKDTSHEEHEKRWPEKNSQTLCSPQCSGFNDAHITFRKKIPAVVPLMVVSFLMLSVFNDRMV